MQNPAKPCKTQKRFNHFKILQYPFASVEFARERERKEERKFCFLFFFTAKLLQNRIFFRASPPPCAPLKPPVRIFVFPPGFAKVLQTTPLLEATSDKVSRMPKNKIGVLQSFAEFCRVRQEFCTKIQY